MGSSSVYVPNGSRRPRPNVCWVKMSESIARNVTITAIERVSQPSLSLLTLTTARTGESGESSSSNNVAFSSVIESESTRNTAYGSPKKSGIPTFPPRL